jgi:hypothetical protein
VRPGSRPTHTERTTEQMSSHPGDAGAAQAGAADDPAPATAERGSGSESMRASGKPRRAKQGQRSRAKMRPPQREGWMEVYEELSRVSFFETDAHEYKRKWILLRDCWMYLYDSQEDVALGKDAETVTSIDLRGALCQQHPSMERTVFLESSALYTVHGHKHKMFLRAATEKDVQVCMVNALLISSR